MNDTILTNVQDGIALVTLNRPKVLNAWNGPMRAALTSTLKDLADDAEVLAVVITGAGERAFSAGQDLNETKSFGAAEGESWISEWERLYSAARAMPKPFIAALNGVAAGSAFQFSLLTDIRIGHPSIRMGQPEINSGIASTLGPWIMKEMLGLSRTIDLTLTGRLMDADECLRTGLVKELVDADQVLPRSMAIARELAEKPPFAMRLNKQRFRAVTEPGFREALAAGVKIQSESYGSGEPGRMMQKFLEKGGAK